MDMTQENTQNIRDQLARRTTRAPRGPSLMERLGLRRPDHAAHLARHFTSEQLLERGWTSRLIEHVLGEPDAWNYPDAPSVERQEKLYLIRRVLKGERRAEVQVVVHDRLLRKHRQQIEALQLRDAAQAEILSGGVEVEVMHQDELEQHAWGHFIDEWNERVGTEPPRADEQALMFASVHWLRFACTPYATATQELGHAVDPERARRMDELCLRAIAQAYPHLKGTAQAMMQP